MSKQYKVIIFDFFDVIHSDPFKLWLMKYGYEREGGFEEASRLVDLGHITDLEFHQKLSELSGQPLESVQAAFGNKTLIDKQIVKLIEQLHPRYKMGLLSNASGAYLRPILEDYNIAHIFDEIVISGEVGLAKPSTEIFHYMLNKMDIKPEESVFIDDNTKNVEAATSLGITAIVYTTIKKLIDNLRQLGIAID